MFDRTTIAVRYDPNADTSPARSTPLELSVLVPTRNEAGNIEELLRRVTAAVAGVPTEVVFIDDSDDLTPAVIRTVARRGSGGACQVSLIHRQGIQRAGGLAGAVVDGLRAARAPWACVLDADLQHPPEVIPMLLAKAERDGADLVVASRHCERGRADGLGPIRSLISTATSSAARRLFPWRLRGVTDPMSRFFLVRAGAIDLDALRPRGFKILLELLVRCRALRRAEVGFAFADRYAGESKGSLREGLNYLRSLCELRCRPETAAARPSAGAPAAEPLVPLLQEASSG
jgi:glycosyltransferase involved in cell wall biosynthesis